ncbi:mRNA export factor GLE1-like [Eurosta solidaginis]|uniref:mRNA export factor GLE1-like n=1 Tax=Eurosta solidaginis TaxID=178769 RepID=UPI003530B6D2
MNDKQPVGYSEDAEENTVTSTNTINRMSASPRSITTQVAKLTYPGTAKPLKKIGTKKQCKPIQHTHDNLKQPESEAIDTARNEFSKKREERDKEVKEFKSYITGIATSREEGDKNEKELNRGSTIHKNEELKINTITTFRRCKTEILSNKVELISERPITTRKGAKERSKSSHLPDTKSKDLLPSALCNTKRKSYNVEEARKFLQQQKRRRRCQQSASALKVYNEKNAFEKEEIKKRLEELRKNSRAIITKNVKRKKTPLLVKATTNRNVTTTEKQEKSIADIIVEPTKKTGIIYVENNNRSENKGTSATIENLSERSRSNGERKTANVSKILAELFV